MPRGGKKDDKEDQEGRAASSVEPGSTAESKTEGKLEELAELVTTLVRVQASKDEQAEKVSSIQECRWRSMQQQCTEIQQQVSRIAQERRQEDDTQDNSQFHGRSEYQDRDYEGPAGDDDEMSNQRRHSLQQQREPLAHREPKLLPLSPEDDIEQFLTTFERIAYVCHWPRDGWAVRLVPLLTGKARSAYVMMDMKDSDNYGKVKAAILSKFEITPDTYRRRFRSLKIESGETPQELYVRLKDLFVKWVKPGTSTVEEITETIILEQFLRMLQPELEIWIREHDPKTAAEAARLAEVFTSARKESRDATRSWENN